MTRRSFFAKSLACFGAMVLAPVRAVCQPTFRRRPIRWTDEGYGVVGPLYEVEWGEIKVTGLKKWLDENVEFSEPPV